MVLPEFDRLAREVAHLLGQPGPLLQPDELGIVGFSVQARGVTFSVVQSTPPGGPWAIVLLTAFGQVPEGREAQAWQGLLDANFTMLGLNAPAFCRNPSSGEVLLRGARPLEGAAAQAFVDTLQALADVALAWRESLLVPLGPVSPAAWPQGMAVA